MIKDIMAGFVDTAVERLTNEKVITFEKPLKPLIPALNEQLLNELSDKPVMRHIVEKLMEKGGPAIRQESGHAATFPA